MHQIILITFAWIASIGFFYALGCFHRETYPRVKNYVHENYGGIIREIDELFDGFTNAATFCIWALAVFAIVVYEVVK